MLIWVGKAWKNKAVAHAYYQLVDQLNWGDKARYIYVGCGNKIDRPLIQSRSFNNLFSSIVYLLSRKQKNILTYSAVSTICLVLIGFNVTFWVQGSIPHESHLRNGSFNRFAILLLLELLALKLANRVIYVSPYMQEHYERLYPWLKGKGCVIYCNSDLVYNNAIKEKDSYCYLGGISEWQKFSETVCLFENILEFRPDAHFYIVTRNVDAAIEKTASILNVNALKKISILSFENRIELQDFLSRMQFGFLLRDDVLVNNVASPIKLAEYLSCDVNVITTIALRSFSSAITASNSGIVLPNPTFKFSSELVPPLYQPANALKMYHYFFKN